MAKGKINNILNPKVLSRIIFPEIQLMDHFKEVGFIDRDLFKRTKKTAPMINKNNIKNQVNGMATNLQDSLKSSGNTGGGTSSSAITGSASTAASAIGAATETIKTSGIHNKKQLEVDAAFDNIDSTLPQYVLGQQEYLKKLSIAFQRPYIYGKEDGLSNIIFITGPKGSGRHLSITAITRLLKQHGLIRRGDTHNVDLAKYKTEKAADNLFIPDLYKALYSQESVVVFEHFDQCEPTVLEKLDKLGADDTLRMDKRYKELLGRMNDVSGSLELDTTDEIKANGKFLVFITELPIEKIQSKFSGRFMKKVSDIITTNPLNDIIYSKVTKANLKEYKDKVLENFNITINFHNEIVDHIVENMETELGCFGINQYIEEQIYKPLVELKLNKKIKAEEFYNVILKNQEVLLSNETLEISLTELVRPDTMYGLEELNKELEQVIGLDNVKDFIRGLEKNIKVQKERQSRGQKDVAFSLHMIFTGNPGTGKTTMARIMARYLKVLGYLSSGHLVEVTRSDLVGQYVGETAQKTVGKINAAKGGILFIDEAYSLARDKNDTFGIEAIDELVKAVEDHRDDLVVILAGYSKEMGDFLKTNSGLKSRFNHNVNFEDYTPEQLLEISKVIAESNKYSISEDAYDGLIEMYERSQIKGKNDSGNGRLARNIVERAIAHQSTRLSNEDLSSMEESHLNLLTGVDFGLEQREEFDLEEELSEIIGLEEVKEFIRDFQMQLIAADKRKKAGIKVSSAQSLNMIFTGNPGTGKTTVARLVASLMKKMGLLKQGHIVETDRGGLISEYAGQTGKKTTEIFMSALGGVLFIDEAYGLMTNSNDSMGKEAIDTLVKLAEDYREDIVVILAGYEKEMKDFLKLNSGLKSRFPFFISFADYTLEELFQIGKLMVESKGFKLHTEAEKMFKETIYEEKRRLGKDSGNGRLVRNIIEEAIREQSERIAVVDDISHEELILLRKEDFQQEAAQREVFDLEAKLRDIIGLEDVKTFIRSLQAQLRIKEERKKVGLSVDQTQTLHMVFKGNPGTGKTTMARIVGDVLYDMGILKNRKFVETDRSGLVAGYVGQTAIKTREKIEEALGGILFIDEAYALAQDVKSNGFGKEAIDTIVKATDDLRDQLVVILAGYSNDMDQFMNTNPGLKSRFTNVIEFTDYQAHQLMEIAELMFAKEGYQITKEAKEKMQAKFEEAIGSSDFGNGRFVRNLFEKTVRNQAVRLQVETSLTKDKLITIEAEDIQ